MAKKLVYDRVLFTTVMLLVGLGLVMVYSASAALVRGRGAAMNPFLVKQAAAAALGFLVMAAVMHVDYRKLRDRRVVYALVAGVLVLLVAVLFSPQLNATRRWFFIARRRDAVNNREVLWPAAIVTGLLAGLILLQPDLGTAVLLVLTAGLMLFLAGLSWRFVLAGAAIALPVLYLLVISVPYRRARLFAFLEPERDPLGAGFQAMQSLIAVGSGGLLGLGPGNSLQKLYFLPHPESDFVYAIVAEELGMIGALAVVALFGVVLWRGLRAGWRSPDPFGRYLAWGFSSMLVMQALINISVAIALLPTKGIPLPFLSYGGSSLVVTMTICGVLLNVSQHD